MYIRIIKMSAWYDLIVTLPFMFPFSAAIIISKFSLFNQYMGWEGEIPVFEPFHIFFMNLLGSIVVAWSILRIIRPIKLYGLVDGITRLFFSFWMAYYAMLFTGTSVLWIFFIPELIWGIIQLLSYQISKK